MLPLHRQHPIRGAFLDPRAHDQLGAVYHDGVDIAVRDDVPGRGAPAGRTHRVHAVEGGQVTRATPHGVRGLIDIAHFRYEHVDALVRVGDARPAGTTDRVGVEGRLARPPRRARRPSRRPAGVRQSAATRRQARAVRRHGEAGDRGGALLHAGDACLGTTTRQRRPLPASRPQAEQAAALRDRRRSRSDRRPAVLHRLVQGQALAGGAPPSVPRRCQRGAAPNGARLPRPRRLPVGTDARAARGRALRTRHRAEPSRRRLRPAARVDPLSGQLLVPALPASRTSTPGSSRTVATGSACRTDVRYRLASRLE